MYKDSDVWTLEGEYPDRNLDLHKDYLADENNPIFVSFTNAGRTYLSYCIQRYFNKLVIFEIYETSHHPTKYNNITDPNKVVLLHTHDELTDGAQGSRPYLAIKRPNVIYLVRNPVDVVFANTAGKFPHVHDTDAIVARTLEYKAHVNKWVKEETFTKKKTVIRYDAMQWGFVNEFSKIISHIIDVPLRYDNRKLVSFDCDDSDDYVKRIKFIEQSFLKRIDFLGYDSLVADVLNHVPIDTKEIIDIDGVKRFKFFDKVTYPGRFVYEQQRNDFRNAYGNLIWDTMEDVGNLCI